MFRERASLSRRADPRCDSRGPATAGPSDIPIPFRPRTAPPHAPPPSRSPRSRSRPPDFFSSWWQLVLLFATSSRSPARARSAFLGRERFSIVECALSHIRARARLLVSVALTHARKEKKKKRRVFAIDATRSSRRTASPSLIHSYSPTLNKMHLPLRASAGPRLRCEIPDAHKCVRIFYASTRRRTSPSVTVYCVLLASDSWSIEAARRQQTQSVHVRRGILRTYSLDTAPRPILRKLKTLFVLSCIMIGDIPQRNAEPRRPSVQASSKRGLDSRTCLTFGGARNFKRYRS